MESRPASFFRVFDKPVGDRQTVVVLGTPRGGTSMVAGLCRQLGVFFGQNIDPANNEDAEFTSHRGDRSLLLAGEGSEPRKLFISHLREVIESRNASHRLWGWKDPLSVLYINDVYDILSNVRTVCILRDPIAVSAREIINVRDQNRSITDEVIFRQITNCSRQQRDIIRFLNHRQVPSLFVSYERSLRQPDRLASELSQFLGIPAEPDRIDLLSEYIQPERNTADISPAYQKSLGRRGGGAFAIPYRRKFLKYKNPDLPLGNDSLKYLARKAETALAGSDFETAERHCHEALAAVSAEVELTAEDPRTITFDSFRKYHEMLPPIVLRFWYILGIRHLQADGDPDLAHHLFLNIIRIYDHCPRFYTGSEKQAPFWSTQFHYGFSSLVIGDTTAAIAAFSRLLYSNVLEIPLDKAAREIEGEDYVLYSDRAKKIIASMKLAAP